MGPPLKALLMVFALATMALHGVLGHVHDATDTPTSPMQGCSAACPVHSGAAQVADPTPVAPVPHLPVIELDQVASTSVHPDRPPQPANPRAPPSV